MTIMTLLISHFLFRSTFDLCWLDLCHVSVYHW